MKPNARRDGVRNGWKTHPPQRRRTTYAEKRRHKQLLAGGPRCYICGGPADEIDHVVPLCMGGTNDPANLKPICRDPCHLSKSAREANHVRWHVRKIGKRREDRKQRG
jgi:hypothetical protein